MKTKYFILPLFALVFVSACTQQGTVSTSKDLGLGVQYFDSNGQPISQPEFAVIGGISGIRYIKFTVIVTNKGQLPLDISIAEASPSAFSQALPIGNGIMVQSNQSISIDSNLIDVLPYTGSTIDFSVKVSEKFTCPQGNICILPDGTRVTPNVPTEIFQSASKSLKIDPETLSIDTSIQIVSDSSSTGSVITVPSTTTTLLTPPPIVATTTITVPTTTTTIVATVKPAPSGTILIKKDEAVSSCTGNNYVCPVSGYSSCRYQVYVGNSIVKDVILSPTQVGSGTTGGGTMYCYLWGTPTP